MSSGNQHRRIANRNCPTNSLPYGYGGLTADTSVRPVRIIMFPTSSSTDLVGRNARSATALITGSASSQGVWRLPNVSGWQKPPHRGGGSQQGTKHRCIAASQRPRPGLGEGRRWYVPLALTAWRM